MFADLIMAVRLLCLDMASRCDRTAGRNKASLCGDAHSFSTHGRTVITSQKVVAARMPAQIICNSVRMSADFAVRSRNQPEASRIPGTPTAPLHNYCDWCLPLTSLSIAYLMGLPHHTILAGVAHTQRLLAAAANAFVAEGKKKCCP